METSPTLPQFVETFIHGILVQKPIAMAEMLSTQNKGCKSTEKRRKLSTRVDLTPMVDLGFLLITFFIFTTRLTQPTAFALKTPANEAGITNPSVTAESKTLQLVLNENDITCIQGSESLHPHITDYGNGIRAVIQQKKRFVTSHYGNGNETVVIIKPGDKTSYRHFVEVLDEMRINDISRYFLE